MKRQAPSYSRLLISVTALGLVLIQSAFAQRACASAALTQQVGSKTKSGDTEQRFGQFTVVKHVEQQYGGPPVLDAGSILLNEAILHWRNASGGIGFSIVDNGRTVQFRAEGADNNRNPCIIPGLILNYDTNPSTPESWRRLKRVFIKQARMCPLIPLTELKRAELQWQSLSNDYVAAANAWKALSVDIFGSGHVRCIAVRQIKLRAGIFPQTKCTQFSKP